ncbi:MAG: hypothetical protein ACKOC5_09000, partial [Chloroflexota bacterium]
MSCPRCMYAEYQPGQECPGCGFNSSPEQLQRLGSLRFLLDELDGWQQLPAAQRRDLQTRYTAQLEALEHALGLRRTPEEPPAPDNPPPPDAAARLEAHALRELQQSLALWVRMRVIHPAAAQEYASETAGQLRRLTEQEQASSGAQPSPDQLQRAAWQRQLQALEQIERLQQAPSRSALARILQTTRRDLARLEQRLLPEAAAAPAPVTPGPPAA